MSLSVYERTQKKVVTEVIYGAPFLRILYPKHRLAQWLVWPLLQLLCRLPFFSTFYGSLQKKTGSAKKISPFIKDYQIDVSEFESPHFESFNAFFTRRLKKEARPIGQEIVAPADGRYRFIPSVDSADFFYAKGQRLNLKNLLKDPDLIHQFQGGSMVIARLAPPDYHRFHYPINGEVSVPKLINGPLFSVNPCSLAQNLSNLTENKRFITKIRGDYGTTLFIELGATCVGSIHHTGPVEGPVKKGDEKGYFSFGASAVILLFEKDRITFDADLLAPPANLEVRCLMGEQIAT